jgi:GntR family transcriptional regulator
MQIIISNASEDPIYKQIMDQIRDSILSGELGEGDPLPSIRKLAKDLQISVITTNRVYDELEKEGFIQTIPGKGSFVAVHNQELLREKRLHIFEEKLVNALSDAKALGLPPDELVKIISILYAKEE